MPADKGTRNAVRRLAAEQAAALNPQHAPVWEELEGCGRTILQALALPESFLGFAMVSVSNAFWRTAFAAVPFNRRQLLLPKCLSSSSACIACVDSAGLHCAECGACSIINLKRNAERLGYKVLITEGTSATLMRILEGDAEAILGVACLDSLEKSFARIVGLGIPNLAVPLLTDGCIDTTAELDEVIALLTALEERPATQPYSLLPLLRDTAHGFEEPLISEMLAPYISAGEDGKVDNTTEIVALDWLKHGGKRFRPFVTLAAYAVARHGLDALSPDVDAGALIPVSVRRLALSVEAMHKASLVHDDIEDDDAYRYGRQTLHRQYGVPPAINIGDYLVGLGYRLIAGESETLGSACVADMLAQMSAAHLELCRGQGAELLPTQREGVPGPREVLAIYARKTAPAFEVALYLGLRAAETEIDAALLHQLCIYLGEGYQVLNDLQDWRAGKDNKRSMGRDVITGRPTILRAFTAETGRGNELLALADAERAEDSAHEIVAHARALYDESGAFVRAERLIGALRERALELASKMPTSAQCEWMQLLVRMILQQAPQDRIQGWG